MLLVTNFQTIISALFNLVPIADIFLCESVFKRSFIARSSQCSTTGVTKAVVCAILSVG